MPISVHVRGGRPWQDGGLASRVESVFTELRRVDTLLSPYRADSEVSRLARREVTTAECDPLVREVVVLCERAKTETGGYFDAWLPTGFDPSGVVKGWAVERASRWLADLPYDYYLNAGGDIAVGTAAADSPGWRIGVEDPRDGSRMLDAVQARRGGVATSGITARGQHVLDPHTGTAACDLLSVTVIGPSLTWADVYATAAFARGRSALSWLKTLHGWRAVVVDADGGVWSC